jgi:hypothetical protein
MEDDGRMYYWQYLTKPEVIQNKIGNAIDGLTNSWDYGQIGYRRYKESIEIWKEYGHLINDERVTEITRKMIGDLLESCLKQKLVILNKLRREECFEIINKKKTKRIINAKQKIKNTLNKLIPKLRTNMIARQKKQFLINIESAQLPHDLENLIFSYYY